MKYVGLLAQDAYKLFPSLVSYSDEEDIYTIDYAGFSIIAIQAVKEQQKIIDELKSENELLKARLDKIEKLLDK